ncbi:MarR family transcriptional regulator [Olivibacter sp. CPCC 100613]|uniref:MarR family winged helix-turn-helix transcriptional regulator n=1 Tax=Olivibacter sp. CPCC 100613 TaxID=3079931 RepID=UPI002FF93B2A
MSNVIDESGLLAISTRLQRLSDQLRKDGLKIYESYGILFEPKWFPVIYTLHKKPVLSVVEIANEIGYTHPSTISLLKELEKKRLIKSKKDKTDERKRLLYLSPDGRILVEKMLPIWALMVKALEQLTNTTNNLMKAIDEVEHQMKLQGFFQRATLIKEHKGINS